MQIPYTGVGYQWLYPSAPDNDVHLDNGQYPDINTIFMNSSTQAIYILVTAGAGSQIWKYICYYTDAQSLIAAIPQANWTQSNTGSTDYIKNKPTIPAAQIQSDWNQTSSSALDFIKNKPTLPSALSQSTASRSLNSAFQVNATRWSEVRYSVDISTTVSLTGGAVGRVVLEMATNSGFTTGVQELQSFGNGNTGTLVIGLVLTQLTTACLSGMVPPGNYVRIRTVNTTGTPTFTYISGQEALL